MGAHRRIGQHHLLKALAHEELRSHAQRSAAADCPREYALPLEAVGCRTTRDTRTRRWIKSSVLDLEEAQHVTDLFVPQ
jgi:hypothetical protein